MAAPDIPAAKRAGLPIDLERLARDGDGWLTPEERYALKTFGVCAQEQDHVFMVRVRIPGGVLPTFQARGLARLARTFGPDWLHLTTRQNLELHWVEDRTVPTVLREVERLGLSTRSACGHTMRNVMCSEDAGLGLDEPFDCLPDARAVSDALLARSAELNVTLPSRINIAFGGSPRCRADALVNDAGFVSTVIGGEAGYELWAGGSVGKAPALAIHLGSFIPRADVLAAAEALVDVFVAHGDFDHPAKARMKSTVEMLGAAPFRAAWDQAFADARSRPHPAPAPVEVLAEPDRVAILTQSPPGGWSSGVRPQRTPGLALLTVDVPLGDTCGGSAAPSRCTAMDMPVTSPRCCSTSELRSVGARHATCRPFVIAAPAAFGPRASTVDARSAPSSSSSSPVLPAAANQPRTPSPVVSTTTSGRAAITSRVARSSSGTSKSGSVRMVGPCTTRASRRVSSIACSSHRRSAVMPTVKPASTPRAMP